MPFSFNVHLIFLELHVYNFLFAEKDVLFKDILVVSALKYIYVYIDIYIHVF